jgi:hypothetical protein
VGECWVVIFFAMKSQSRGGWIDLGKFEVKVKKVEVDRPGKVEVKEIDNKSKRSTDKRSTGGCMATD